LIWKSELTWFETTTTRDQASRNVIVACAVTALPTHEHEPAVLVAADIARECPGARAGAAVTHPVLTRHWQAEHGL
jgi:hypothetical protein